MSGKAPWKITRSALGAMILSDANGEPMAEFWPDAPMSLIEAAPDLLAALEELAACEHDPKYAPEVMKAGRAIMKAKGRLPDSN